MDARDGAAARRLILGVNGPGPELSFALIDADGELLGALEDERSSRVPGGAVLCRPDALFELLESCGAAPAEIGTVAFAGVSAGWLRRREALSGLKRRLRNDPGNALARDAADLDGDPGRRARLALRGRQVIAAALPRVNQVLELPHHLCSAAASFEGSGFARAAVVVSGAAGETDATWLGVADEGGLRAVDHTPLPHDFSALATQIAWWLGFAGPDAAARCAALAVEGEPRFEETFLSSLCSIDEGTGQLRLHDNLGAAFLGSAIWAEHLVEVLGPPRLPADALGQRQRDVAASLEAVGARWLVAAARALREQSDEWHLCLAGAGATSGAAVAALREAAIFDGIWVPPQPGPAGAAIGAAALARRMEIAGGLSVGETGRKGLASPVRHAFFGPEAGEEACVAALGRANLPVRRCEDPAQEAARALSEGQSVAWVQGRAEIGGRSLATRALLLRADDAEAPARAAQALGFPEGSTVPNIQVAVAAERLAAWFPDGEPTPFGDRRYRCHKELSDRLVGVMDARGEVAVQTVDAVVQPRLHALLGALEDESGLACVAHVSLASPQEPPALSPADAVAAFQRGEIDVLLLGDFVLRRDEIPADATSVPAADPVLAQLAQQAAPRGRWWVVDAGTPLDPGRLAAIFEARRIEPELLATREVDLPVWTEALPDVDAAFVLPHHLLTPERGEDVSAVRALREAHAVSPRFDGALLLLPPGDIHCVAEDFANLLRGCAEWARQCFGVAPQAFRALHHSGVVLSGDELWCDAPRPGDAKPTRAEAAWLLQRDANYAVGQEALRPRAIIYGTGHSARELLSTVNLSSIDVLCCVREGDEPVTELCGVPVLGFEAALALQPALCLVVRDDGGAIPAHRTALLETSGIKRVQPFADAAPPPPSTQFAPVAS